MPTTLTYSTTVLTLPDHLAWPDEFAWSATRQRSTYSAAGALLLDVGTKLAGRPITLQGSERGGRYEAWAPRSTALHLRAWADAGAAPMTLALRGSTYTVGFAPNDEPLVVLPVVDYADPANTDLVIFTLRLITLS